MKPKAKRVRRQPEEARRLILDAAESTIAAVGPGGLRLQDVAKAAGVSHPTILHHFGSREGLLQALNMRTVAALRNTIVERMTEESGDEGIRATFAAYRDGLAQRMLWLLQSDVPAPPKLSMFDDIVSALHAFRLRRAPPGKVVDIEDTRAAVHLTAVAAFGDALIGPRLRQLTGDKERAAGARFEDWFCALMIQHMRES